MEVAERAGMNPAVMASAASVFLSWYLFFVRGDRNRGIFVGLWPPTILAFTSYFEQAKMNTTIEKLTGSRLMNRLERMMQTQ